MLRREYDRFDSHWLLAVVFDRDPGSCCPDATSWDHALLANFRQTVDQSMSKRDWHWHQFRSLIARVSEHQALVTSTISVNAHRNVGALRNAV